MSLDSVELVMEFENWFGISIPDQVAENLDTVDVASRYIARQIVFAGSGMSPYKRVKQHLNDFLLQEEIQQKDIVPDLIINTIITEKNEIRICVLDEKHYLQLPGFRSFKGNVINFLTGTRQEGNDKFEDVTLHRYTDALCSLNYKILYTPEKIYSLHDVRICVMGICIEKMGIDPFEIDQTKSFTNDLGID